MIRRLSMALLLAAFLSGATAYAHHSFAATYVEDKAVTIDGTIEQFMYRNPHSYVHVMVKQPDGSMMRWAVEWGAPAQLAGVSRDTLKPGDRVVITGHPGRDDNEHRLRMMSIERPSDGWKWSGTFR